MLMTISTSDAVLNGSFGLKGLTGGVHSAEGKPTQQTGTRPAMYWAACLT